MPTDIEWTRDGVNRFWDGVAKTRLDELSFSKAAGGKLLDFVGHHLAPGTRCLDFGAGDGSLVRLLLERGCKAAALEPSPERRALIADAELASHPGFLGFVDGREEQVFDVVIAAEVIEHVLDDELPGVLEGFRRYLKPGGLLIVTTPNDEDLELGSCYCPVSDLVFHRWQHVRSFTADSLAALLSDVGFSRLEDHRVDFSASGELYEQYVVLLRENRYLRWLGPLYYLLKPLLRKPPAGDLRIGAQNGLVYVGELVRS